MRLNLVTHWEIEMESLIPKLERIKVDLQKLVLDPNNPRLMTGSDQQKDETQAVDLNANTFTTLNNDSHDIQQIIKSIKQNGWTPIDSIFVKSIENGRYLVLEGNRRVTALMTLAKDEDRNAISNLDVMEVIDEGGEIPMEDKITYLLGVRHHGSLKKWSPFARANNIYERYIELSDKAEEEFAYDDNFPTSDIAASLTIGKEDIKSSLKVFRAMQQIGQEPDIKASEPEAGMKDRYYSVIAEAVEGGVEDYIVTSPYNFLLTEASLERIKKLCKFDKPGRLGAVVNKPQEWRSLRNILKDKDETKREINLKKVEEENEHPSAVWAQRTAELHTLEWGNWLQQVVTILQQLKVGSNLESDDANSMITKLDLLIEELESE